MKIVVLDGYTLSPLKAGETSAQHPSWDGLAEFGELVIHPRTKPADVVERAAGATVLLTNKVILTRDMMAALPDLKYIGVMATGTNVIDLEAAAERGIVVTNVPGYSTNSVVQIVLSLRLEVAGRVGETAATVRDGGWSRSEDFCYTLSPFAELSGKTLGIVGFGAIGSAVARVAVALGMEVCVFSRTRKPTDLPIEWLDLDSLFAKADVISLHCPLTPETKHMINAETLGKMKRGAFLINTGRGPLLDEAAVAEALHSGQLGGLSADVLSAEPPPADNPLIGAPNTVITPHIAWASIEARGRLMQQLGKNLAAFLNGNPVNVV